MSDDPSTQSPEAEVPLFTVCLKSLTILGARLLLQPGDILIAVNGAPFAHPETELTNKVSTACRGRCALTFLRGTEEFTVLVTSMDLGTWGVSDAPKNVERKRIPPGALNNWEIYKNEDGLYDIQVQAPSLMALVLAPLWLAQMRLWTPLSTVSAVLIITLPFGSWIATAVYGICSVYVWRNAQSLFRTDREARGMELYKVIAAPSEKSVHLYCQKQTEQMIFMFSKDATATAHEETFTG